jgi:chromosome segregation ATPase
MKLTDFLTYDDAEFRPGPYLNMVLGPNGTGKSSIACAICLGLAFPLKVSICASLLVSQCTALNLCVFQLLGRAAEISSFVKIGSKKGEATVEIELKGPANKKNIIIKRTFQATSKTSTFTLNGKPATQKDVQERVRTLNVQVDNLW